jgi:nitrate reductase delta subunit
MFGTINKSPDHLKALDLVAAWTRARFNLAPDAAILVSEVACSLPGCPPLETVVAFWTEGDKPHHFKLFKPVAQVVEDDLPPRWMKNALIVPEDFGAECC